MPAYIVGRMNIQHRAWMEEYFSKVSLLVQKFGGRFLVRGGNPGALEGHEPLPDAVFVVEFPSRERATAFWHSAEFAPLIRLRQSGSTLESFIVDGW